MVLASSHYESHCRPKDCLEPLGDLARPIKGLHHHGREKLWQIRLLSEAGGGGANKAGSRLGAVGGRGRSRPPRSLSSAVSPVISDNNKVHVVIKLTVRLCNLSNNEAIMAVATEKLQLQ